MVRSAQSGDSDNQKCSNSENLNGQEYPISGDSDHQKCYNSGN